MSIRGNIEAVIALVKTPGNTGLGDEIQQKAVATVMAGAATSEWRAYMQIFAKNAAQLERLMAEDGSTDYLMDVARTYLIGNGVCGAITIDRLLYGVDDKLDEGL